jgi:hypothetical protein
MRIMIKYGMQQEGDSVSALREESEAQTPKRRLNEGKLRAFSEISGWDDSEKDAEMQEKMLIAKAKDSPRAINNSPQKYPVRTRVKKSTLRNEAYSVKQAEHFIKLPIIRASNSPNVRYAMPEMLSARKIYASVKVNENKQDAPIKMFKFSPKRIQSIKNALNIIMVGSKYKLRSLSSTKQKIAYV